ncbi:ribosomal protein L5 [Eubacterium saphenum ATCC 49989]|nr:ribosomal protein L5 [Eubacterium saphenum ATCC 49989]
MANTRLEQAYKNEIFKALMEKFGYKNPMQVPKLEKITLNIGLGEAKENSKLMDTAIEELKLITGQKPVVTKAKKSIANFKVREGMAVGLKVTLRGDNMYVFADKFFNIALPRVRDFKGVNKNSFDGRGNYSMGIKEQLIFPEIVYDDVDLVKGMNIVFTTTAKTDEEALELLKLLGLPFEK